MKEPIVWKYDNIKNKNGKQCRGIIYGDNCFTISTKVNRLLAINDTLRDNEIATLFYTSSIDYHRFWGTFKDMKKLAQDIKDNTDLFNRMTYFNAVIMPFFKNDKEMKNYINKIKS